MTMQMASEKAEILIVDDVPTNIQLLAQLLKDDYVVKVATSGERCMELAMREHQPDLILLDVVMPDMDGYEVCKSLREMETTRNIPIVFLTGKVEPKDEEYGFQLGAVDYITRPFLPAIVEARIRTQITLKQQRDLLEKMAMYDQLTGLYNRHYLLEAVDRKVAEARAGGSALSMVVLDIDYFKSINDKHGHNVGDVVLQEVGQALKRSCRSSDVATRYGGEEFVLLFDHCDLQACLNKADTLRQQIEGLNPHDIPVTASFGITMLQPDDSGFDELFHRADQAVYQAKSLGRNRVEYRMH